MKPMDILTAYKWLKRCDIFKHHHYLRQHRSLKSDGIS